VARAFAVRPKVLLLDEPFGALDAMLRPTLQDALLALWSSQDLTGAMLMVTHDIDEAIYLSDRVVVMTNGPEATIAEVVEIALPRPRDRRFMVYSTEYIKTKDRLMGLLSGAVAWPSASAA
jgi:ABC-type nitrate/sulfonate/bicarbonate transport system ATPase subunit